MEEAAKPLDVVVLLAEAGQVLQFDGVVDAIGFGIDLLPARGADPVRLGHRSEV
jgi:hypothetical protein